MLLFLNIVFVTLVFSCSTKMAINEGFENNLILEIQEFMVEPQYSFKIENGQFSIYKIQNFFNKKDELNSKITKTYSKKISKENFENIVAKIQELSNLDSAYITPALGGIGWTINYRINGFKKNMRIENTNVPQITELFKSVNVLIPPNNRKITIFD